MAQYKTELPYKFAAEVLQNFLEWRAGDKKMQHYKSVDAALKTAINVLQCASNGISAIPSDADLKIEKIRSILNE